MSADEIFTGEIGLMGQWEALAHGCNVYWGSEGKYARGSRSHVAASDPSGADVNAAMLLPVFDSAVRATAATLHARS